VAGSRRSGSKLHPISILLAIGNRSPEISAYFPMSAPIEKFFGRGSCSCGKRANPLQMRSSSTSCFSSVAEIREKVREGGNTIFIVVVVESKTPMLCSVRHFCFYEKRG
jgi:hypothetical protein